MDICGEHGDFIAYSGRDCPACSEIEQLHLDHKEEIESVENDLQEQISELRDEISELDDKIGELENK